MPKGTSHGQRPKGQVQGRGSSGEGREGAENEPKNEPTKETEMTSSGEPSPQMPTEGPEMPSETIGEGRTELGPDGASDSNAGQPGPSGDGPGDKEGAGVEQEACHLYRVEVYGIEPAEILATDPEMAFEAFRVIRGFNSTKNEKKITRVR